MCSVAHPRSPRWEVTRLRSEPQQCLIHPARDSFEDGHSGAALGDGTQRARAGKRCRRPSAVLVDRCNHCSPSMPHSLPAAPHMGACLCIRNQTISSSLIRDLASLLGMGAPGLWKSHRCKRPTAHGEDLGVSYEFGVLPG